MTNRFRFQISNWLSISFQAFPALRLSISLDSFARAIDGTRITSHRFNNIPECLNVKKTIDFHWREHRHAPMTKYAGV